MEGEIGNLAPGPYEVEAYVVMDSGGIARGVAIVEVGESDARVDIILRPQAKIFGSVITEPGEGRPARSVSGVRLEFTDPSARARGRHSTTSQNNGSFAIPVIPPGIYRFNIRGMPSGMYLAGIFREDDTSLLQDELSLESRRELKLTVVLGEPAAAIHGTVVDASGNIVPGAIVALLPDNRNQWTSFISATADGNGSFELKCAPGGYRLFSWMELEGAAFRNSEFMKEYDARGVPVRLEKGGRLGIQLVVLDR
jgi:hypothetical protein